MESMGEEDGLERPNKGELEAFFSSTIICDNIYVCLKSHSLSTRNTYINWDKELRKMWEISYET